MSGGALHELRPRSAVELYDAALHLCVHTRSELPVLALVGAAPLFASGLWGVWLSSHREPHLGVAVVFALALVFRQLCQGAGGLAALRELEGNPLSPLAALREASRRTPSLIIATAWLTLFQAVLLPASAGISMLFFAPQLCGPVLIVEGSANGFDFGRVARARLRGRSGAAAMLQVLHLLALLFLMVNLHGVVMLGLLLGHTLLGLDLTFIDRFTSLSHAFYDLCLFATAQLLLDPVRCATSALVLADARVRHEGFDLLAALRRLQESRAARAALLLLVVLPVSHARADTCPGAVAANPEVVDERRDPVAGLRSVAEELGLSDDPEIQDGLRRADALPRAERAKLSPLLRRLDHRLDQGTEAQDDAAADELTEALTESARLARPPAHAPEDPRLAAQRILAQDEFRASPTAAAEAADAETREPPGWWVRFWKWVGRQLAQLGKHAGDHDSAAAGAAVTGDVAQMVTWVLVVLAVGVVLVVLVQLLARHKPRPGPDASGGQAGPGLGEGEAVDALSKPVAVWGSEADALAAQGRFREAMRALYLALLATLHRRGAIDYHPTLSNWDYCAHFQGEPSELAPFRELTLRFDFGWYGRLGADQHGYGAFRSLCAPLLEETTAPGARRA